MVSIEDALKKMQERAKKRKAPQVATTIDPLASDSPTRAEKRKEVGPSDKRQKDKRPRRETIDVDVEPISINFLPKTSLWKNPDVFSAVLPQFVFEAYQPVYERLGEVGILERTAQVALQSVAALSWVKEKSEASARKLSEAVETHNNLSSQYNALKKDVSVKESENANLKKKLEDMESILSAREKELKDAKFRAEYYEDKSTSMKLFTTVKVRAEMTKEYAEGKALSWDPEAASSAWEEMKLLYYDPKQM